jgi:xanthine dehydrogenase accessory factor
MAKDPVCGMQVDEASARFKSEYNGQEYYFCCEGCQRSFEEDPGKYLAGDSMGHDHGGHGH